MLQALYDCDVVGEEAFLTWADEKKLAEEGDRIYLNKVGHLGSLSAARQSSCTDACKLGWLQVGSMPLCQQPTCGYKGGGGGGYRCMLHCIIHWQGQDTSGALRALLAQGPDYVCVLCVLFAATGIAVH